MSLSISRSGPKTSEAKKPLRCDADDADAVTWQLHVHLVPERSAQKSSSEPHGDAHDPGEGKSFFAI